MRPLVSAVLLLAFTSAALAAPAPSATPDAARAQALYREVRTLRAEQRWAEAIAALQEAIRVGPYNEDAHYLLGSLMEQHATPEAMIAYWSAAVATDPKPQTAHYFWAIGLERTGDLDAAIARLQVALEVDPAHEMSELRWAQILMQQGKLEEALVHCRTAIEILPDFRPAHEACATVLERLGRADEAAQARAAAQATDPKMPRRYVQWARYLAKKGRTDAAVAELERALRENPQDAEARTLLASLKPAALPTAAPVSLEGAARAALLATLRNQAPGTPVWLAVQESDPGARARAESLAAAFAEAGWTLRGRRDVPFRMKPGVYLFAADAAPPAYVDTARAALEAAGLAPVYGSDYRAYSEERAQLDRNFRGFPLLPDQTYLIVISRP